jgi:hypothetical protein
VEEAPQATRTLIEIDRGSPPHQRPRSSRGISSGRSPASLHVRQHSDLQSIANPTVPRGWRGIATYGLPENCVPAPCTPSVPVVPAAGPAGGASAARGASSVVAAVLQLSALLLPEVRGEGGRGGCGKGRAAAGQERLDGKGGKPDDRRSGGRGGDIIDNNTYAAGMVRPDDGLGTTANGGRGWRWSTRISFYLQIGGEKGAVMSVGSSLVADDGRYLTCLGT